MWWKQQENENYKRSLKKWLNCCISQWDLNRWRTVSCRWAKKVACWDAIYSWWRCWEDGWDHNRGSKALHRLSWLKQWQDLRGWTPILKEVLLWIKCYQTESHATENSFMKGKVNQCDKLHCCLILKKKLPDTPTFSNYHLDQWVAINIQVRPSTSKVWLTESSDVVSIF